jgi:hypothetical protein
MNTSYQVQSDKTSNLLTTKEQTQAMWNRLSQARYIPKKWSENDKRLEWDPKAANEEDDDDLDFDLGLELNAFNKSLSKSASASGAQTSQEG